MSIESFGVCHVGRVRPDNEDRTLLAPSLGLYIVCDGMGGHAAGEVAAEVAIEEIRYYIDSSNGVEDVTHPFGWNPELSVNGNRLVTGLKRANQQVRRRARSSSSLEGMGTTIAAVLLDGRRVAVANVGDARAYHWNGSRLEQWSQDDTLVAQLVQRGLIAGEQAHTHPMRNMLSQAAGPQENIDPHCRDAVLNPGDMLLLASDGLAAVVTSEQIQEILETHDSPESCVGELLDLTLRNGAPDNVSIIVLRYQ